jgi:acetyl-CoA carboxylase carboxyl transferase subunit alpha
LSEGGSGGALAIGVTDHLMMLDNSIYSIISPEGFASILFKDSTKAKEAANFMKLTAEDLKAFGIASTIIKEPTGGFHEDIPATMNLIDQGFKKALTALQKLTSKDLLKKRYDHYRHVGIFEESKEKINE